METFEEVHDCEGELGKVIKVIEGPFLKERIDHTAKCRSCCG